ncbi:MAG: Ig domain-containing protein [Polyangiaceae bacterium]
MAAPCKSGNPINDGSAGKAEGGAGGEDRTSGGPGGSGGTSRGGTGGTGGDSSTTNGGSGGTAPSTQTNLGGNGGGTTSTSTTQAIPVEKPSLPTGKTNVAYSGTVTASGAERYTWSIAAGSLPAGLALQNTTQATVTLSGTPTEAGLFPVTLSVTDGSRTSTVDVTVGVTHRVAFLSDRITSGVKELFLTEVGAETVAEPVRLNAPLTSGGVTSFSWSPDGTKIAYTIGANLFVVDVKNSSVQDRIALGAVAFRWVGNGASLAVVRSSGALVVDVSTPPPWKSTSLALPTIASDRILQSAQLVVSPRERDFSLTRVTVNSADQSGPAWEIHHVAWNSSSASVGKIPVTGWSPIVTGYGWNGQALTVEGGGVAYCIDVSNPLSPQTAFSQPGSSPTWSPTSAMLLSSYDAAVSEPKGVRLRTYVNGTWDTGILRTTTCEPIPGPWSPNGSNVLFTCGGDLRGIANVVTAPQYSDASLLGSGFFANPFTSVNEYHWSPDSNWIAVLSDRYTTGTDELFLVRFSSPSNPIRPYSQASTPGVSKASFSPNSNHVAFVGTINSASLPGLHLSALPAFGDPRAAVALTPPTAAAVQNDIAWLPGSRVILYRANDAGGAQLHAALLGADGSTSTSQSISGAFGTGVTSYQPAP